MTSHTTKPQIHLIYDNRPTQNTTQHTTNTQTLHTLSLPQHIHIPSYTTTTQHSIRYNTHLTTYTLFCSPIPIPYQNVLTHIYGQHTHTYPYTHTGSQQHYAINSGNSMRIIHLITVLRLCGGHPQAAWQIQRARNQVSRCIHRRSTRNWRMAGWRPVAYNPTQDHSRTMRCCTRIHERIQIKGAHGCWSAQ